ncbi:hypothetical protein, partial [Agrobacterium sp. LAD9]|uniref:hypothetical protein n=1 Tax=Agrobacterium sp. LAD9 TaxID=2055153 RepID=UPI001AED0933
PNPTKHIKGLRDNSEPFLAFLDLGNYDIPSNRNGRQISNLSMPEIIQKLDLQDHRDRPLSTKDRDPEEQRGRDGPVPCQEG